MKTLIVSATLLEAEKIIENLNFVRKEKYLYSSSFYNADLLITGIGEVACVFSLLTLVDISSYDFVLNAGIAGAYTSDLKVGGLYNVNSDCFADTVIQRGEKVLSVFELMFSSNFTSIIKEGIIKNNSDLPRHFKDLPLVSGNTVNKSNHNLIGNDADVESMEGAAFMMVCEFYKKTYIQLRAISNVVNLSPFEEWDLKNSISNLTSFVSEFINDTYYRQLKNII